MKRTGLSVESLQTGLLPTSTYIVIKGKKAVIIDPAESNRVEAVLVERKLSVEAIVNTHGHYDHIGGNKTLKETFGCPIIIGAGDAEMLTDSEKNLSIICGAIISPEADILLQAGEYVFFEGLSALIIPLPGHTSGGIGICFEKEEVLFTGDTLFVGGIGRTDLPGGDMEELKNSLRYLRQLDPGLRCYPGHGPSFYLGEQFSFIDMVLGGI